MRRREVSNTLVLFIVWSFCYSNVYIEEIKEPATNPTLHQRVELRRKKKATTNATSTATTRKVQNPTDDITKGLLVRTNN